MKITKDKRTNLEKEIDSLLKCMSDYDMGKQTSLDLEIERTLGILATYEPSSPEYSDVASNLEKLYNAKSKEKDEYEAMVGNLERLQKAKTCDGARCVSPDTIAMIAANLLGIIIVLGYEKANVITSKAFSQIIRGRV